MTTNMRLYRVPAGRRAEHFCTPSRQGGNKTGFWRAPSTRHEHPDSRLIAIGGEPWLWGLVAALLDGAVAGRVLKMIRFPRKTDAGRHGYIRTEARIGLAF